MPYFAIATDYDGTLAADGKVDEPTWAAIAEFRQQGGKILLVTGREFEDLRLVCPNLNQFDAVIAENGAVLYWPDADQLVLQGSPPPSEFIDRLRQAGVEQIQTGQVIVATWHPHGEVVKATIASMRLNYQVILNKKAVMVLPAGVDKASGLQAALATLQIDPSQVAGIGDAENDTALLNQCGLKVAVANALPDLKAIADYITQGERSLGVQELIHQLGTMPNSSNL